MRDDHYVPDLQNAHIDTGPLIRELEQLLDQGAAIAESDTRVEFYATSRRKCYPVIYDHLESKADDAPDEPGDDDLVCRYLSPEKFLWFLGRPEIYFSRPNTFDDDHDCALHEDFNLAVQTHVVDLVKRAWGLPTMSRAEEARFYENVQNEWAAYERSRRHDWLVSSWTRITEHEDDKLLLHKYAGGRFGIGITARYGELKEVLQDQMGRYDRDGLLRCGLVNYDKTRIKALPFNKRPGFKGEQEVRFAFRSPGIYLSADVGSRFSDLFNLRLSTDSPSHHHAIVRKLWVTAGGNLAGIHTS